MKRTILLTSLLLSFSGSTLFAATNVPSAISGDVHWDQSGSPYFLQGHVTIPAGARLSVGPAVQVIFQGAAVLEVNGTLEATGSAAGPAVFNLQEGGLQSEIFINGGEAHFTNVKIQSGVFLAKDAKLTMDGADVTKGSGIYLQGSTVAHLKNNKIYGNSTGVVLDGQVLANLQFNTLVQNTYGLYVKSLSQLTFQNNSIHDNQMEVISMFPTLRLGGNYWGTNDSKTLKPRIQGKVTLSPMRTLKDVLRVYVRTQLPAITKQMALALAAREKKEAKDDAAALKKFRQQQANAAKAPAAPAIPAVPAPSAATNPPVPSISEATVPAAPAGPPPVPSTGESAPSAASAAPPVPSLPDSGNGMPPVPPSTEASTSPAASAPPAPGGNEGIPAPPDLAEQVPPASPASTTTSSPTASSSVPAPPPVPGSEMPSAPAPPPEVAGGTTTAPAPSSATSEVPPSAPPVPAVAAVASAPSAPPPAVEVEKPGPTPIPPAEPTAAQLKIVNDLKGVNGDIDGMQAPPLETSSDLSPVTSGTGSKMKKKASNVSNLDLPPLKDSEILPPKDLDLPPTEDLGNINLNSPSK